MLGSGTLLLPSPKNICQRHRFRPASSLQCSGSSLFYTTELNNHRLIHRQAFSKVRHDLRHLMMEPGHGAI